MARQKTRNMEHSGTSENDINYHKNTIKILKQEIA